MSTFTHSFKYPLMEKCSLTITGTVLDYADRFAVNLCTNICYKCSDTHKDIVFHFNPRLTQNYVARNSYIHDTWGNEESKAQKRSPFRRGQTFVIEIFVTKNEYMVSVNGKHFCSYEHRLPPTQVDSLEIHGDVNIKRVDACLSDSYPTSEVQPGIQIVEQPYIYSLQEQLSVDSVIQIRGRVQLLPYEFRVNFQSDTMNIPHPTIPYHLSMRWRPDEGDSTIINAWIHNSWGEEVVLSSLLRPNSSFVITIYVKKEGYSTVVKAPVKPYSLVLPLFAHRTNPAIVSAVFIQGDVTISDVAIKKFDVSQSKGPTGESHFNQNLISKPSPSKLLNIF